MQLYCIDTSGDGENWNISCVDASNDEEYCNIWYVYASGNDISWKVSVLILLVKFLKEKYIDTSGEGDCWNFRNIETSKDSESSMFRSIDTSGVEECQQDRVC